jgi:hypothetical protein
VQVSSRAWASPPAAFGDKAVPVPSSAS